MPYIGGTADFRSAQTLNRQAIHIIRCADRTYDKWMRSPRNVG
jgi:hypothetical protein